MTCLRSSSRALRVLRGLLCLAIAGASLPARLGAQPEANRADEMNTWLMASTFKLQAPGSIGTTLILGRPYADAPDEWRHVMVTSAQVLGHVIGDEVTLVMRQQDEHGAWVRRGVTVSIRKNSRPRWVQHREADVAAMYVEIPAELVPKPLLHVDVLATDERLQQYRIHPGDQLLCLGYPFGLEASESGFPILQRGTIASYPLLPSRSVKTFLFDLQVFPGHSGGPVYMDEKPTVQDGRLAYSSIKSVVGLLSQERLIQKKIEGVVDLQQDAQHPLGLARVVHAALVRDTIELLPNTHEPAGAGQAPKPGSP